jgi:hypothetical protein
MHSQSIANAINAEMSKEDAARRRRGPVEDAPQGVRLDAFDAARKAYACVESDELAFTTAVDEPVFSAIHSGRMHADSDGRMQVLPTLNGLNPNTAWTHVRYAGVAIKQTNYAPNRPIAIKQSGKAKLLNTGTKVIRAGDWWELYAMPTTEANAFKKRHSTPRVMAGTRAASSNQCSLAYDIQQFEDDPTNARGYFTPYEYELLALNTAVGGERYRIERQSRVIGRALHTALPGQYAEVLLSQHVPG